MPGLPEKFLPLFPALMALAAKLSGGAVGVEAAGRAASVLAGAALAPLLFLTALRLGAGRATALVAAAAAGAVAVGLDQYRDVNVMPLFTALLSLCVLLHARGDFIAAGVIAGLCLTTRFEGYLLLPALLAADFRDRRGLLRFALGLVLAAGPWWARNLFFHGHAVHTYYMAELVNMRFHLPAMITGLFLVFGPLAPVAAAASLRRLPKSSAVLLAVFLCLYLALHSWWWFYRDHFLLPLTAVLFPAAAVGLDRIIEWRKDAGNLRVTRAALAGAMIAPVLIWSGVWLNSARSEQPDPYVQAARSLADDPAAGAVIGSNPLLIQRVSGRPALTFDGLGPDVNPHELVARGYTRGARTLVWKNHQPADATLFGFLADGRRRRVEVNLDGVRHELIYAFSREYDDGKNRVLVYDLILKPLP